MDGIEFTQANALNALASFSKLSKTIAACFAGSYLLYLLLPFSAEYLALVPGKYVTGPMNLASACADTYLVLESNSLVSGRWKRKIGKGMALPFCVVQGV